MADVNIGTITARLTADAASFIQNIQAATQALAQFQRQVQSQSGQAAQGLSQATQGAQQLSQQLQQLNQQALSQTGFLGQMAARLDDVSAALQRTGQAAQQTQQQTQSLGDTWRTVMQIASGIGLATSIRGIVGELTQFVSSSVQLAARMDDLARSFRSIEGSSAAAQRTLGLVFDVAQRGGLGFEEAARGLQRLEAGARGTTLTMTQIQRAFEGIVIGGRAMGISTQQSEHALVAWEQILTKGRLSSEELVRQLGNAIPGGLTILAQGLGTTSDRLRDMAEANLPIATTALVAFGEAMRVIGERGGGVEGLSTTFARLHNETKAWMDALGGWLGNTLLPALNKIIAVSEDIRRIYGISTPGAAPQPSQAPQTWLGKAIQAGRLEGLFPEGLPGMPIAPPGVNQAPVPAQLPIAESRYTPLIARQAGATGIDPGLLSQVIRTESSFNPYAGGLRGPGFGLGQVTLPTAQGLEPGITREQLMQPEKNVELAARYLAQMLDAFKDTDDKVRLALTAYESGAGTVRRLLGEAARRNLPQTLPGILQIPEAEGGLGPQGRAYAGKVLETSDQPQISPAQLAAGQQASATAFAQNMAETLDRFTRIKAQIDDMTKSGETFAYQTKDITQQADQLFKSLTDIQAAARRFPELIKEVPPELLAAVDAAARQAAMWRETNLTAERRVALLKQQVEMMEQLDIRQRAQLRQQTEGQEAAERFARQATQALQERRVADQPRLAGLSLQQQIAESTQRLQALEGQVQATGAQIEAQRVAALRPQIEAQLTQIETFLGRAGESLADKAANAIRQRQPEIERTLTEILRKLDEHPGLKGFADRIRQALADLPAATEQQAQEAYDRTQQRQLEQVRQAGDAIEQISLALNEKGLQPLDKAMAEINKQFETYEDRLTKINEQLKASAVGGTEAVQAAAAARQEQIAQVRIDLPAARERAETHAQVQDIVRRVREESQLDEPGYQTRRQLEDQLAQQRQRPDVFGYQPDIRLQRQKREGEFSEDEQKRIEAAEAALKAQSRLNYAAQVFEEVAGSVGQAWTSALTSIADGTKTVGEAFREMARSILQSLAQIASQEAFKALTRLGVGLIAGSLGGGLGAGGLGGESPAAVGAGINPVLFQHGGLVNQPTFAMLGEAGPEYVVPQQQMQHLMSSALRAAPTAGGQAAGAVTVINVASKEQADQSAIQQRALGRQVVINHVLDELSQGESSKISRLLRTTQR